MNLLKNIDRVFQLSYFGSPRPLLVLPNTRQTPKFDVNNKTPNTKTAPTRKKLNCACLPHSGRAHDYIHRHSGQRIIYEVMWPFAFSSHLSAPQRQRTVLAENCRRNSTPFRGCRHSPFEFWVKTEEAASGVLSLQVGAAAAVILFHWVSRQTHVPGGWALYYRWSMSWPFTHWTLQSAVW